MKHPGFLRLISALYMVAPRFRLLRASFDLARFELADLARLDPGGLELRGRDVDPIARLGLPGERRALDDSGHRRRGVLTHGAMPQGPPDQAQRDQSDSRVEQLGRSADFNASARRTCRAGPYLGKPGQTTCATPLEASDQHRGDAAH